MINKKIIEFHLASKKPFFEFLTLKDTSGSYLFAGPKGIGKKDFAFFVSAQILSNPHKIDKNIHPDFLCLSNEKDKILVEDIEKIEKWVLHPPFESTKKIIVIPKAETINLVAQNKLLKILEEPPEYLFFFLLSPTPDLLLPTIRSRCINVNFQLLPVEFLLQSIEDKFEEAELLDLSIFLLNGSINNIEFYSQDNLQEMIEFVSMILKRDPANVDLVSDKIDEITKKDFNQLFFVDLVIGILSYALKLKHLNNFKQTSIFNINTLKNIPSMSIIELISKMTSLASDLRWSNFNFRMGMEEILFDFILDTNLAELKAV